MLLHILYYTISVVVWNGRTASCIPVTYDHRQTGDLNVQIDVKDVQVIALLDSELLDDYTDYDYSYDYSDFTIKPIVKPTTGSPISTSSVKPWNTWPTNPPTTSTTSSSIAVDSQSSSSNSEVTTMQTVNPDAINEPNSDNSKANSTIYNLGNLQKSTMSDINVEIFEKDDESTNEKQLSTTTLGSLKKLCPSGYALSKKGRCRSTQARRRISLVPLTMKLGSKLSQKSRFTVRKDLPIRVYKSDPRE